MSKFFRRQPLVKKNCEDKSTSSHTRPRASPGRRTSSIPLGSAYAPNVPAPHEFSALQSELWYQSEYDSLSGVLTSSEELAGDPVIGFESAQMYPYPASNNIEKLGSGDHKLRIQLTGFTFLKQTALGVRDAHALLIYVRGRNARNGFCMHVDPDPLRSNSQEHNYWNMHDIPDRLVCPGRQNRVTYQLSRSLWKYLVIGGADSPDAVLGLLTRWLASLASRCITCGNVQGVRLYRPTVCCSNNNHWHTCNQSVRLSALDVRLLEIRQDPAVVELLLTSVYAAAQADTEQLLPYCPISDSGQVLDALQPIPRIATLSRQTDISRSIHKLGQNPERLLCWASSQYRGFLMSVPTGSFFISGLPDGTLQFLLADAGPELERKFEAARAAAVGTAATRQTVFFHGTTLDRVYAILSQGLRILSNDPLQRNGAAYGNGVYVTDSPSVALGYATRPTVKISQRPRNMEYYNYKVLLCCELACDAQAKTSWGNGSVFVITDESTIILRYIFLIPPDGGSVGNEDDVRREIGKKFRALQAGK